jgi:helix-turn-helix protein
LEEDILRKVTVAQAAHIFGKSPSTIYTWVKNGRLMAENDGRRIWVFLSQEPTADVATPVVLLPELARAFAGSLPEGSPIHGQLIEIATRSISRHVLDKALDEGWLEDMLHGVGEGIGSTWEFIEGFL